MAVGRGCSGSWRCPGLLDPGPARARGVGAVRARLGVAAAALAPRSWRAGPDGHGQGPRGPHFRLRLVAAAANRGAVSGRHGNGPAAAWAQLGRVGRVVESATGRSRASPRACCKGLSDFGRALAAHTRHACMWERWARCATMRDMLDGHLVAREIGPFGRLRLPPWRGGRQKNISATAPSRRPGPISMSLSHWRPAARPRSGPTGGRLRIFYAARLAAFLCARRPSEAHGRQRHRARPRPRPPPPALRRRRRRDAPRSVVPG